MKERLAWLGPMAALVALGGCRACGDAPATAAGTDAETPGATASQAPYLPARSALDEAPTAAMSVVEGVLFKLRPRFNECYRDASRDRADLEGKVVFQVKIDPTGKVTSVSVHSQSGLDMKLIGCLTGVLESATFPPHDAGTVAVVNVPLAFKPPRWERVEPEKLEAGAPK